MGLIRNLIGQTFGQLKVLKRAGTYPINGAVIWRCKCYCGNFTNVIGNSLLSGRTRSCGCLHRAVVTLHGQSKSPTWNSWRGMIKRCYEPTYTRFADWGGRGIRVCNRWRRSFINFLQDMGERPQGCTLDRIDNDGNYTPENCRWATPKEQCRTRR